MPTMEQLNRLWESEFEFGIGARHGFGSEHADHIPTPAHIPPFTGKVIGHLEIDPETKMPRLVLDKDFLEEKDPEVEKTPEATDTSVDQQTAPVSKGDIPRLG